MPDMVKQCPICFRHTMLEEHHITPVSLGGDDDGPRVWLCSNCHHAIHKAADILTSKHHSSPIHPFNDNDELERARPFIQAILTAKYNFESAELSDKPRRRMFVLQISDVTWRKLHKRKLDQGFTSMNKYLTALLNKEANSI